MFIYELKFQFAVTGKYSHAIPKYHHHKTTFNLNDIQALFFLCITPVNDVHFHYTICYLLNSLFTYDYIYIYNNR